jgi:hypothetical protein
VRALPFVKVKPSGDKNSLRYESLSTSSCRILSTWALLLLMVMSTLLSTRDFIGGLIGAFPAVQPETSRRCQRMNRLDSLAKHCVDISKSFP